MPVCSIETILASTSLGPINKKRQLKSTCSEALQEINNAFNSSSLGSILSYGFIYGSDVQQEMVKTAIARAVKIVADSKGIRFASELALTPEMKQKHDVSLRVLDWVQLCQTGN